ncbi:MAG: Guanylate kinase [Candidatus Cloacimonetes bacterium ADurb.Bin088]|nr:MAG: Guanylate kinase [Candidatus Cloacimonetes bacterium ADurb.Bin088]
MIEKNPNFLIILSAPSGGGKSTILAEVLKAADNIDYSVSYTTRPPRGTEQNGVAYHFVDEREFLRRREEGDFLETAQVFGRWYGTSKSFIRGRLAARRHVIMDIDVQGAAQIHTTDIPHVKIFIIPPSMEILRERLMKRATDSPQEIEKRLTIARKELEYIPNYDYLVVNNELSQAVREVLAIVQAEENRVGRYRDPIKGFLKQENQ